MARPRHSSSNQRMMDGLDPVAFALRLAGALYVFAGIVAGRAALMSATLDAALAGLTLKPVSARERALTIWLVASAWLVFASGALLMVLAQEAVWAFVFCALTQGFYLTFAAPYYFDVEDPPDPAGRRQTTNAFFVYLAATLAVIWASDRYMTPLAELHPVLSGAAWLALATFGALIIWQSISASRMPHAANMWSSAPDAGDTPDYPDPPRAFDPRMLRVELSRDGGASPVKNQKTGADVDLASLYVSGSLKSALTSWLRDGDPQQTGAAFTLAERLARECPDIAVAEPGIPNAYFGYDIPSPYADPETGTPNWDRMTAVKIMCDYDCHPVWAANDGAAGDVPPSVLKVSSELEDALLDWQDRFDASFNPHDPAAPRWTPETFQAHEREALDLARRVKAERPDMTVTVDSPRGLLVVDASTPPEAWVVRPEIS
jgi:hypothetical protein